MITLQLNGEDTTLPEGSTVRAAVASLTGRDIDDTGRAGDGGALGLAVAVDGTVVPRSRWATTPLTSGAMVEIVTAVQGG